MTDYLIVWRDANGGAVQTYANDDKTPKVFTDPDAHEGVGVGPVGTDKFSALLATKEAFEPRRVAVDDVRTLLGWSV